MPEKKNSAARDPGVSLSRGMVTTPSVASSEVPAAMHAPTPHSELLRSSNHSMGKTAENGGCVPPAGTMAYKNRTVSVCWSPGFMAMLWEAYVSFTAQS